MYYSESPIGCCSQRYKRDEESLNGEYQRPSIGQREMPELPTGAPTGPAPIGRTPRAPEAPTEVLVPPTIESPLYLPGYLKTQIGKNVRVEFLIGSNGPLVDRIGTLLDVGVSYILIRPIDTDDILMCDIFSIKFVTIYQ